MDDIRRRRREVLNKECKKRRKKKKQEKNVQDASRRHHKYTKEGTILSSKYYKGLKKRPCPKNVCLDSNIDKTIKFIRQLPGAINPNRKTRQFYDRKSNTSKVIDGYFDFPSIEKICPASALIISANYFMYKKRGGIINVVDWGTWNKEVKNTLTKMGFFGVLKFKEIATDESLQEVPIKGFKMGRKAYIQEITTYFTRLIERVPKTFNIDKDDMLFKKTMYSIIEAVENSVRHAYPRESPDLRNWIEFPEDLHGRWWFGGMLLPDEKQITFVCYDKGLSIPRHIKNSYLEPKTRIMHDWVNNEMKLQSMISGIVEINNNRDHIRLKKAMEYAKTSTEKEGGGKGLSHIAETIKDFPNGKIRIMSRRAHAVITKNKDPVFTLLDTPIIGTLIVWEIKL